MGEERGSERACGIHGSGMLNRNDESRGEEIRWVEKKKKEKKHSRPAREFIIDARLFGTGAAHEPRRNPATRTRTHELY